MARRRGASYFAFDETDFAGQFSGNTNLDFTVELGIPLLLEAKLERNNPPFYNDIAGVTVHFDIYASGSWQGMPDDGISSIIRGLEDQVTRHGVHPGAMPGP